MAGIQSWLAGLQNLRDQRKAVYNWPTAPPCHCHFRDPGEQPTKATPTRHSPTTNDQGGMKAPHRASHPHLRAPVTQHQPHTVPVPQEEGRATPKAAPTGKLLTSTRHGEPSPSGEARRRHISPYKPKPPSKPPVQSLPHHASPPDQRLYPAPPPVGGSPCTPATPRDLITELLQAWETTPDGIPPLNSPQQHNLMHATRKALRKPA